MCAFKLIETTDRSAPRSFWKPSASSASWAVAGYASLLAGLILMRLFVGDRSAILFAVNSLFLYAFAPLPFVAIGALAFRRISFLVIALSGIVAWCGFWGELFLPRDAPSAKHPLVLLSYNALGYNRDAADTVRVIQDSRADLVALQELNPETAAAIERHLHIVYPYRWLDPRDGLTGGAILSKFPFTREPAETLPGSWVGTPMVAVVDFMDTPVTFVRFHAVAGPARFQQREQQARALAKLAQSRPGPLVVAGDLNATDQNRAYAIITEHLRDAWRHAGWGFGHTFPGEPTAEIGGSRPVILGVPVPLWLVRIDYIFYSKHLQAAGARLSIYGGASDHRGVVATLTLR